MKRFTISVVAVLLLVLILPAYGKSSRGLKHTVLAEVESLRPVITEMSSKLWDYAELALKETKSAELLMAKLEAAGFTIEKKAGGLDTAFVATYGKGEPVIGILAEYDALPGIGNEIVPKRQERKNGNPDGHGCGHNVFGASSTGGAIALKTIMQKHGLKGTIKLFGCPAEETGIGKVIMAREGVFNGLDAVIDWHPATETGVNNSTGQALNNFEVEFFGQPAHGAYDPWNGRSALDAVELMNYGVNLMREHIRPSARIHYVIVNGGGAPNVVPAYAKAWYYVREWNRERVLEYYKRILKIAKGAAIATETEYKVTLKTGLHEYNLNRPIQEILQKNLELVGAPKFSKEEHEFGRAIQRTTKKPEKGYYETVNPLADKLELPEGGSTDSAEVSWLAPTAGFYMVTAAHNIPWHSWATTACHGTSAAHKSAVNAAKVIAASGLDLLTKPGVIKKVKQFFKESTKGKPYVSPLDEATVD